MRCLVIKMSLFLYKILLKNLLTHTPAGPNLRLIKKNLTTKPFALSQLFIFFFCLGISSSTFAGWEVAKPVAVTSSPAQPFFQVGTPSNPPTVKSPGSFPIPNHLPTLSKPTPLYAISVSGSLKENIERIMERYHWKVIWKAPFDYNFDGRVTGSSLPNVMEKLLKPFPLQAQLFMSNHIMTIVPRKV